ncbi:psm1 [Symbiodinium microadriaticum]|nr:psm1 [Symbiodinium microadriaticum]
MDKLRKRKVELEEAVAENRRRTPGRQHTIDIETKLKTLQTRMNLCDADLKVCEEKLAQLKQQQVLRDKNSSDLRKELKSTEKTLEKKQRRLSDLEGVFRSVESEVFHDFSSRMGVENIRDFEETRLRQHKELILRKNEVAEQRATLQAQLEYETKRDFQGALKTHLALITSAEKEIAAQSKVVADLDKQMAQTQKLSEDLRRKRDELRREKKTQEEELRALQAEVEEVALPAVLDEAEEAESGARSNKQGTKGSKRTKTGESSVGELARASSDSFTFSSELDLRWRGSTTSLRSSSSSANIQGGSGRSVGRRGGNSSSEDGSSASSSYGGIHFSESDNPVVQRDSEKVAMVDLSSLRAIVGSDRHEVQVEKEKQLSQEISELVAELESMQPNMHAGERFEEVRDARQKLFQTCFQHVSESLAVIYKDLTRSSKHPLGGNAYLSLDNTEEPYIGGVRYTAMPPSKRFRDMDQLSGGEKTVAALALLFSIHRLTPPWTMLMCRR